MNIDIIGFLWFAFKAIGLLFLIYFVFDLFAQSIITNKHQKRKREAELALFDMLKEKFENGEIPDVEIIKKDENGKD
jgi:uncharacterized membrane protein